MNEVWEVVMAGNTLKVDVGKWLNNVWEHDYDMKYSESRCGKVAG